MQLVVCAFDTIVVADVERLSKLELLFIDGYGDVVGEWATEFNLQPLPTSLPRFAELAHFISGILANRAFVSHHVEGPLRVIAREFDLASAPMPEFEIIDTLDLARRLLPGLSSYSIDALQSRMAITAPTAVQGVWQLLCHLQSLDPDDSIAELRLVAAPSPVRSSTDLLAGRVICVSGALPHLNTAELQARLRDCGATVLESPTSECELVVLGLGYNAALAAFALSLNLPLLGIEWFELLCRDPHDAMARAGFHLPRSISSSEPSFQRHNERQL